MEMTFNKNNVEVSTQKQLLSSDAFGRKQYYPTLEKKTSNEFRIMKRRKLKCRLRIKKLMD